MQRQQLELAGQHYAWRMLQIHLPDDISQPKIEQEVYTLKKKAGPVDPIIPTSPPDLTWSKC